MPYSTHMFKTTFRFLISSCLVSLIGVVVYIATPLVLAEENPSMQPIDGFPETSDAVNNQSIQEKVNYGNRFIWKEKRKSQSPEAQSQRQQAFENKLKQREMKPLPSNSESVTRKLKPKEEPNIVIQD